VKTHNDCRGDVVFRYARLEISIAAAERSACQIKAVLAHRTYLRREKHLRTTAFTRDVKKLGPQHHTNRRNEGREHGGEDCRDSYGEHIG
jgi:hypothetical protein